MRYGKRSLKATVKELEAAVSLTCNSAHTEIIMQLPTWFFITLQRTDWIFFACDYLFRPRQVYNNNKRKNGAILIELSNQRTKTCLWLGEWYWVDKIREELFHVTFPTQQENNCYNSGLFLKCSH